MTVRTRHWVALLATLHLTIFVQAGPLGPLPNETTTTSDLGLDDGSCRVGSALYAAGNSVPGSDACEQCQCVAGAVRCERATCEPRPGCKALHRPDHCCPTYQCECEQEGHVYGNGEKLVDPADPCRVCYCQGGEVVCRRIACFVRDDCRPRLVPGRCCPEYDNCPLRGVTAVPGMAPSMASIPIIDAANNSMTPSVVQQNVKQEITIKEITPVSEIPVITEVKIKEILPSPSIEVSGYTSSKSPLIPREATSEKSISIEEVQGTAMTSDYDRNPLVSPVSSSTVTPDLEAKSTNTYSETKHADESSPSKISLSQDAINSDIYPSNSQSSESSNSPVSITPSGTTTTTKAPIIEEEDTSIFEHNPAFPPLPDDLSVLRNHDEDIVSESNIDGEHGEHITPHHEIFSTMNIETSPEPTSTKGPSTAKLLPETTISTEGPTTVYTSTLTQTLPTKLSPMINLRSAIPTEILSVPSAVPEEITGELDETEAPLITNTQEVMTTPTSTTTQLPITDTQSFSTEKDVPKETMQPKLSSSESSTLMSDISTPDMTEIPTESATPQGHSEEPTPKSNITSQVTSQTELSSLPIETSDQNPPGASTSAAELDGETGTPGKMFTDTILTESSSSEEPMTSPTSIKIVPTEAEPITISRIAATEKRSFDNFETTEFLLTSFGSSESATDPVELIKVTSDAERKADIVDNTFGKKNNVLTDLINLVGDVASISAHTDEPHPAGISDSEELIPVNAGYKSKNNNFNSNSITEVPIKSKSSGPSKSKIVEIEEEEDAGVSDPPPPNHRMEPTTRRPLIDNVTEPAATPAVAGADIEIITHSYVPRRPSKVVLGETTAAPVSASAEAATDDPDASAPRASR